MTDCVRGCTRFGRHVTDCEDRDECRGCLPRAAEFGLLCESCHLRLASMIQQAPAQRDLLEAVTTPSSDPDLSAQTIAQIPDGWRLSDTSDVVRMHAKSTPVAYEEGEPVRIACLDVAQEIADVLSMWVERLCEVHAAQGPTRLQTLAEEQEGEPVRKWSGYLDRYIWVDPPVNFAPDTARRWLIGQLANLERLEGIGDDLEVMADVMSRAHSLAPWREESKRLPGIPCPECKRVGLRIFDGETDVTCTNPACRMMIPHTRYLMWARIWEDERAQEGA